MRLSCSASGANLRRLALAAGTVFLLLGTGCHKDPAAKKRAYLQSGLAYQQAGKIPEAVIQFSNALQVDPDYPEAHEALAKAYVALGNNKAGFHELERAVALDPANVGARSALGLASLENGSSLGTAIEQVTAIQHLVANSADAYDLQAHIDLRKGDGNKARADAMRALSIAPNRSSFHTTLAMIALTGTKPDVAEGGRELNTALSMDASNASALFLLSELLQQQGDLSGALEHNRDAVRFAPYNLKARLVLVHLYLRLGRQVEAEHLMHETVEKFPDDDSVVAMFRRMIVQTQSLKDAEPAFDALARQFPQSIPIRIEYAQILMSEHKNNEAKKIVTGLNVSDGGQPHVKMLRALFLSNTAKTTEAMALLEATLADSPADPDMHVLLARIAFSTGNLALAEEHFEKAFALDRTRADALSGLADVAIRRRDARSLNRIADQAFSLRLQPVNAYYWRDVADMMQANNGQAEANFRAMLRENGGSAQAHRALGELKLRQNDKAEGMMLLERALTENPQATETLNDLVAQDLKDNHTELAASRVRRLLALNPQNAEDYSLLASIQLRQKDFAGARDSARQALTLNSADSTALRMFTTAAIVLKDYAGADGVLAQWLQSHPYDAQALTLFGLVDEAQGQTAGAMTLYRKALAVDPDQALASNNLAYLMAEKDLDLNVALSLALSARKSLPHSSKSADTLGWVYYHQKRYQLARDLLEEACKAEPTSSSLQYHLGKTYLGLQEKNKAKLHLQEAMVATDRGSKAYKDAASALIQTSALK